jgi:catechol 2,3-dioxygenase-like lactoylglutathione lyase family enzyme
MIDHTGIVVSNYAHSKQFYAEALASIGYGLLMEIPLSVTGGRGVAGFGELATKKPDFWIAEGEPNRPALHIAFRVENHALVQAFHKAALAAGGTDNGAPGPRPHYHQHYFGAFVRDPDGHNIEAVCHTPQ